jgi:hypothetical protein
MVDGWDLVLAGKKKAGIKILRAEHKDDQSIFSAIRLGLAHLYSSEPNTARRVFLQLVKDEPAVESGFEWAGVCEWLLGNSKRAVRQWESGLDCDYVDAGGGIQLPALLCFAAVTQNEQVATDRAISLVRNRLGRGWATNWPGPVGKYLLGQIDDATLTKRALYPSHKETENEQLAQAHFYIGVRALHERQTKQYYKCLTRCVEDYACFEICETYLARYELSR